MEKRYHDYGRFLQAEDQVAANATLFEAGVLHGNALSVSTDGSKIQVGTGSVITSDGVIINNDATRLLTFTPQAAATIFTIVQYHDFELESGGFYSTYALSEQTVSGSPVFATTVSGGVVLGWVRYPGGSVDPTTAMLHPAPKMQVLNSVDITQLDPAIPSLIPLMKAAPFVSGCGCYEVLDTDVSAAHALDSDNFPYTEWTNASALVSRTVTLYFVPEKPTLYPPKYIELIDLETDATTTSTAVSINVDGTTTLLSTLTGSLLSGTSRAVVTDGLFTGNPIASGEDWLIKVVVTLPPTEKVRLRRVRVVAGALPRES